METKTMDSVCVESIRCLSAALPEIAKSGHPGAPMGCAAIAHALFGKVMRFSPSHADWIARDRFVLSNGHACALLYSMLYLCGYDMSLSDLQQFRKLHSKTPGHPERALGVEVTSGPLGQGISQAVGLAIAAASMGAEFDTPIDAQLRDTIVSYLPTQAGLFDSYVYVLAGEGCLQEGVSSEACSLAGHLGLGHLIVLFDCNSITIDGPTSLSFSEDVAKRFEAYNWQVLYVEDASYDSIAVEQAILQAKQHKTQPTLIICHTIIGVGCSKQGSEKVHGAPLGLEELKQCRRQCGLDDQDIFSVPDVVKKYYASVKQQGDAMYTRWMELFSGSYKKQYPALHTQLCLRLSLATTATTADAIVSRLPQYPSCGMGAATRTHSGEILNIIASHCSWIMGGSADLTLSTATALHCTTPFSKTDHRGKYIHYGIREHGMAAITNGIQAFGGFRAFASTFMNFITYAWGAVRLSALSHLPVLYIATHDSIELGEDGPTHQPIEVAALCRATPNLFYFRPADAREVAAAYLAWLDSIKTPVVLALSRSPVPHIAGTSISEARTKGAYVVCEFQKTPGVPPLLMGASGTEVSLCTTIAEKLTGIVDIRVVSMPCWELFEMQSDTYKALVLPQAVPKLYVEAACVPGCSKYFDFCIQMSDFGASAPKYQVLHHFGFTVDHLMDTVADIFKNRREVAFKIKQLSPK